MDDSLTENYLTFKGGYITGGNGSENGGGIYLPGGAYDASTTCLYMNGGNIIGNSTLGHGGGIYYGWVSKRNSIIDLKNVSIIGNVAKLSAGGIYHGANNRYLSLENTKVMNNSSNNKPAGIKAQSQLKVKGNVYVYDNKLKSGEEVDISINHDSQDDRLIVTGELSDESKIGYFNIRRELIYDYFKYNRDKDPNDIFISNTYQSLTKKGDNLYTRGIDDEAIYYDEGTHSLVMAESLANYPHEIKYGIESGNYNLDEAPQYTGIGEYTTYYRLRINDEMEYEGKQKIIINKILPLLPTVIENLKYTGEAQELLSVPDDPGATFKYKIKDGYWTDAIPKGLDINDYEIEVRAYGDSEHADYVFSLTASISSPDKTELKNALTNAKAVFDEVKAYGIIGLLLGTEITLAQNIENTDKVTVEKVSETIENLNEAVEEAKQNKKIVDHRYDGDSIFNTDYPYTEPIVRKPNNKIGKIDARRVKNGEIDIDTFVSSLTNEELAKLTCGNDHEWIGYLPEKGLSEVIWADGPNGLREKPYSNVLYPCSTLVASTWNRELAYNLGVSVSHDCFDYDIRLWLAPAMNIHRNPMCGRNFEYFSEDPILSSEIAAEIIKGVQDNGIAACLKHFAANNTEYNRFYSNSIVSARALREIYFKGFEKVINKVQPAEIMTAYNYLNYVKIPENPTMVVDILRNEFGYKNLLTTDYENTSIHVNELKAHHNLKMIHGDVKSVVDALNSGELDKEVIQESVKQIVLFVLKYTD